VYQDNFGFIHNRKIDITRFLAGDANPIVLTLNETKPAASGECACVAAGSAGGCEHVPDVAGAGQSLAHGAVIRSLARIKAYGVWVHQQAPDTNAPRVSYHIPQAGRTNYPRHAPLSFLVHEHPRSGGPRNGIDFHGACGGCK